MHDICSGWLRPSDEVASSSDSVSLFTKCYFVFPSVYLSEASTTLSSLDCLSSIVDRISSSDQEELCPQDTAPLSPIASPESQSASPEAPHSDLIYHVLWTAWDLTPAGPTTGSFGEFSASARRCSIRIWSSWNSGGAKIGIQREKKSLYLSSLLFLESKWHI